MKASLAWLNRLLDRPASADEAEHALTFAGFPIESRQPLPGGDELLDVEVTSNRGDVLCHLGVAREIAAATGRTLRPPAVPPAADAGPCPIAVDNADHGACPLFTATVVTDLRPGPSPQWLREALEAIGQRSINCIVDVTNFVLHELGQPSHVFDLASLRGGTLTVRSAAKGERLALLDGSTRDLAPGEWVIADGRGPVSLAGIMGGAETAVNDRTTAVVLEVATWRPAMVRAAARRLQIRTDSSHRYERWVPPATVEHARRRLVGLLAEVAGGRVQGGVARVGAPPEPARSITLRAARLRAVLGAPVDDAAAERALAAQGVAVTARPSPAGAVLECAPPAHRPDLRIEEDLIEEVARTVGYDRIPVLERLPVRVGPAQPAERAERRLAEVLAGLGFFEALTFSFTSPKKAAPWLAAGVETISLPDERRGAEPSLRPSVLTGLLACRKANQDARTRHDGGVRLFELAATYAQQSGSGATVERRSLALLLDVAATGGKEIDRRQHAVRVARGAVEAAVEAMAGPGAALAIEPCPPPQPAWDPAACAAVSLNGRRLGTLGLIAQDVLRSHDLAQGAAAAELDLGELIALYPPRAMAHELPRFPPVEKDLTIVVDESTPWSGVERLVREHRAALGPLESCAFVGVYRDPARAGAKNVTFRLTFRDPARTLTNEEIDQAVAAFKRSAVPSIGRPLEELAPAR
ncbi:MAG: phenylalanine--tRNA ligase subunit beta [Phycisphaerae bacterium]|nr:phenylalanine--tRNA ligase subunit beta [Phycisphaerae bacterium]